MAPSILKMGARLGSGMTYGKVWEGQMPFKDKYPSLYKIMRHPHTTVASVLATRPLNLYFRRALVGNKLVEWQNLLAQIAHI